MLCLTRGIPYNSTITCDILLFRASHIFAPKALMSTIALGIGAEMRYGDLFISCKTNAEVRAKINGMNVKDCLSLVIQGSGSLFHLTKCWSQKTKISEEERDSGGARL